MTNIEHITLHTLPTTTRHRAGSLLRRAVAECSRVGAPSSLKFKYEGHKFVLNWTYSTVSLQWKQGDWREKGSTEEVLYSLTVSISDDEAYLSANSYLVEGDLADDTILALCALDWLLSETE